MDLLSKDNLLSTIVDAAEKRVVIKMESHLGHTKQEVDNLYKLECAYTNIMNIATSILLADDTQENNVLETVENNQ